MTGRWPTRCARSNSLPARCTPSSTARRARCAASAAHLLAERGLPREAVSISGYWKYTRTEEGWREDKPEWNRLVEADLAGAR
jgi:hypothetical protein